MKRIHLALLLILLALVAGCQSSEFSPPQMSVLYDSEGRVIRGLHQQNRLDVKIKDISPYMVKAVVAAEDQHFYQHHGIDIRGIARAFYHDIRAGRIVEGGSTITQQTAKNLYVGQARTWNRKLRELYYTLQLERHYSKNEILEMYLNTSYFGEGAYGVESAARTYFNKPASRLTLDQAALLAGIPQRPGYFDPYINPQAAKKRRVYVLDRMVATGSITAEQASRAKTAAIRLQRGKYPTGDAPYFISMVANFLAERFGERMVYQGGLHVYTTLDLDLQRAAQMAFDHDLAGQPSDLQGALVAVEPGSGRIRALIGGRDYRKYPYNRAVKSKRQPGSAFKPFMYSLALESNYTEASTFTCEPVEYRQPDGSVYRPTDYGSIPYHNRVFTLKEALMISDNVVAVRLIEKLGPSRVAEYAKKFGFSGPLRPYYSLALGSSEVTPLEMAAAYAVFAGNGVYNAPYYIEKIEDAGGRIIYQAEPHPQPVLRPAYAYLISDMLSAVFQPGGTGANLEQRLGIPAAGKTGTTQENHDAWFCGYTPRLACAVWVGYDDQSRSVSLPGGKIAGPVWADFMHQAAQKLTTPGFSVPPEIIKTAVCLDSGQLATEYCERTMTMAFIKGSEPQETCWLHSRESWPLLPGARPGSGRPGASPLEKWWNRFFNSLH